MKFTYVPILEQMIALYLLPKTYDQRFVSYLKLVQTADKKEMSQPLTFFNPMAKEHILDKLLELKSNDFEKIMENICKLSSTEGIELQVYFNLADDVAGGWTNKEETIAKSFEIGPYLKRGFCVVVFFASEEITEVLIKERTKEYLDYYSNYQK